MSRLPFNPGVTGGQALRLVREAEGVERSAAPARYYASMAHLHADARRELWSAEAWVELGRAHLMRAQVAEAVAAFEQALLLGTPHPDARMLLGVSLRRLGRTADAARTLERALDAIPDHARAHYELAMTYRELGRWTRQGDHLTLAVEADPTLVEAWYQLGNWNNLGRKWEEAISAYRYALRVDAEHVGALHNLGGVLARIGRNRAATRLQRRLNRLDVNLGATLQGTIDGYRKS